jgi:hypothetical protein
MLLVLLKLDKKFRYVFSNIVLNVIGIRMQALKLDKK